MGSNDDYKEEIFFVGYIKIRKTAALDVDCFYVELFLICPFGVNKKPVISE